MATPVGWHTAARVAFPNRYVLHSAGVTGVLKDSFLANVLGATLTVALR
jgi:hypothetical protein